MERSDFIADIRHNFSFLFNVYSGRVVAEERDCKAFDNALVVVQLDRFQLRFVRDRGEYRVEVSSSEEPRKWELLDYVLEAIDSKQERLSWASLKELAEKMAGKLPQLKRAFDSDHVRVTLQALDEMHKRDLKSWAKKFNNKS